jgi:Holliday junction resolvase-like predicted endonuclease
LNSDLRRKGDNTNTKKKGQRVERLAELELQRDGWEILFKSHTLKLGKIFKTIDFGKFDIVAVKYGIWKFVSVKGHKKNSNFLQHKAEIVAWVKKNTLQPFRLCADFELWKLTPEDVMRSQSNSCFVKEKIGR